MQSLDIHTYWDIKVARFAADSQRHPNGVLLDMCIARNRRLYSMVVCVVLLSFALCAIAAALVSVKVGCASREVGM